MAEARYARVHELKPRIQKTDSDEDAVLFALLEATADHVDRLCNRPDGFLADKEATARYYKGKNKAYQLIDECVDINEVAVKDSVSDAAYVVWTNPTTWFAGDGDWIPFTGDPDDPEYNRLPITALALDPNGDYSVFTGFDTARWGRRRRGISSLARVPTVRVTAYWGYAAVVPLPIREACLLIAVRLYKKLQGSGADALASAEFGVLLFRQRTDPDVANILFDGGFRIPSTGRP